LQRYNVNEKRLLLIGLLLLSVVLVSGAYCDLDWMVVSYRYSEWHRTQETWEFSPYFKLNWHVAYMFTVLRLTIGCLLLGWLTHKIYSMV